MNNPLFIQFSEPMQTFLTTAQGDVPVYGTRALAGLYFENTPFDPDLPFEWVSLEEWARCQAHFWATLGAGAAHSSVPWQTSFELRAVHHSDNESHCDISLWAKSFAPEDVIADQIVYELAEMMSVLFPAACAPQPVTSQAEYERYWGVADLPWLAEIRRTEDLFIRNNPEYMEPDEALVTDTHRHLEPGLADWRPSLPAWRDTWKLLARLPAPVWLSIGICPTELFAVEEQYLQKACRRTATQYPETRCDIAREASILFQRTLALQAGAFLVRIRVGGDSRSAFWLARSIVAAFMLAEDTAGRQSSRPKPPLIVYPETPSDWQAARFNWQWGAFQAWGAESAPVGLQRLNYLYGNQETGIIAGVWG